jgi:uncharacterized protein (TIGR04255 family)
MEKAINNTSTTERIHKITHFDDPPVVETSLGFHFAPIPKWNVVHYGLIWEAFRAKYPNPEFKAPIGNMQLELNPTADFTHFPLRAWFVNESKTQLLQVQNGAFLRNWRKTPETPEYQHYDQVRPLFHRDWRQFSEFVSTTFAQKPEVLRCEISYFNHLVRGREWTDFSEFPKLFASWKGTADERLLSKPLTIAFSAVFGTEHGTAQFSVQPGIRPTDGKEVIQLTVTVHSAPKLQTDEEMYACLDRCHEIAVRGFLQFTSEGMHAQWKRKR